MCTADCQMHSYKSFTCTVFQFKGGIFKIRRKDNRNIHSATLPCILNTRSLLTQIYPYLTIRDHPICLSKSWADETKAGLLFYRPGRLTYREPEQ